MTRCLQQLVHYFDVHVICHHLSDMLVLTLLESWKVELKLLFDAVLQFFQGLDFLGKPVWLGVLLLLLALGVFRLRTWLLICLSAITRFRLLMEVELI